MIHTRMYWLQTTLHLLIFHNPQPFLSGLHRYKMKLKYNGILELKIEHDRPRYMLDY
jgi:hypothetical protein